VQVWCDIFTWERPERYRWRIVIDTVRDLFTVVDDKDEVTEYQKVTVIKKDEVYNVSEHPPLRRAIGNILFLVHRVPPAIEIVGGSGGYKHVVWADGHKIAEKNFWEAWTPTKKFVPPHNPMAVPRLSKYALMVETPVYRM